MILFVVSKMGIDWLFRKIFTNTTVAGWKDALIDNDFVDEDDLGHVRLTCLLRALLVGQPDKKLKAALVAIMSQMVDRKPVCAADVVSCTPDPRRCLELLGRDVQDKAANSGVPELMEWGREKQAPQSTTGR